MSKRLSFLSSLQESVQRGEIPSGEASMVELFFTTYEKATLDISSSTEELDALFHTFLKLVKGQLSSPYIFPCYHVKVRAPTDYYGFGLSFIRALIDFPHSSVQGEENLAELVASLERGENAILLSNHQSEADPQVLCLMLEKKYPHLAENMIFVAGERVLTDPLAVPFSIGCNLLCIYSKRYIDYPPEKKEAKQRHNKKTMQLMSDLLSEGGKCIYVAPSGGRDRPNKEGVVEISPFDPQSVEMFHLMAKRANRPTHFYPLTLMTYHVLPPPATVQVTIGEARSAGRGPVQIVFGKKIDMENIPGAQTHDKHLLRRERAEYIWKCVKEAYPTL